MATTGKNTVSLVVEAGVTGEAEIRKLADDIRKLAREGGDAAPEFAALAAQLDRLGEQAAAVSGLRSLTEQVDALSTTQREAAASADTLATRYAEAKAKAQPLREEQARLAEALREAKLEVAQAKGALDTYSAGFTKAQKDTAEYVQRQAQLKQALADARVAVVAQQQAIERLAPGLREAAAEERKLSGQYDAARGKVDDANDALRRRNVLLQDAQAAALAAGVGISDLAAAERSILEATQQAALATQRLVTARQEAAAIAAELAALDAQNAQALERSARAVLDVAAAYDREEIAAAEAAVAMREKAQADAIAADQAERLRTEQRELFQTFREAEVAARRYAAALKEASGANDDDAAAKERLRKAAEALLASERDLSAEQRVAAQARNGERAALLAQAQAQLDLAAATDKARASTVAAAVAARQAGEALQSAFGTVGIRSIDAIEAEIEQTSAALTKLEIASRRGAVGQDELARAAGAAEVKIARLRQEIQQVQSTPGQFERLSAGINNIITRFAGLGAAIATVGVAVRPVLDATIALDQMRRVLTTVTGSAEIAEQQIASLREIAQQSGQSFSEIGQSYSKFAASALQSGLSLEQVNAVFKSVSLAAGNLGLSSDQAKRALEALSQIASKGTVSMEELRQQLGDALPGVLPLLARELGLTQRELNKVVESGQLLASEAIPAIGRALGQLQPADGVVNGLVATFNRFKNVVLEAGTVLVEGPFGQVAGRIVASLAGVLRDVAVVAVSASEAFKLFGLTVAATIDALTPGGEKLSDLGTKLSDFAAQSGARIAAFKETAYGAEQALGALNKTAGFTGESFAKLTLEQQKLIDAAALASQTAEKNVQAKKSEAEASEKLAALLGDEDEARRRSLESALAIADATEKQVRAQQAEVDALVRLREQTVAKAGADKAALEGVKALIEETDKKIAKGTADVEKTQAQADAARAYATAQELAARSVADNSGRLVELSRAVEEAAAAQVSASRRYAEGKGSLDAVKEAARNLALAKGVLRDAIDDLDKALKKQIDTLKADLDLKRASLELDLAQARTAQRLAQERGNETAAREAAIRIAVIEQALRRTEISNTLQQAEATLQYVATKEAELRATQQLTPERQQELELLRRGALATILKSQAQAENNKVEDEQLRVLQGLVPARNNATQAVGSNTQAVESNTSTVTRNSSALNDNRRATDAAADARSRYNQLLRDDPGRLVGGNGLAGIGNASANTPDTLPQIDSFGNLIRNTPNGGITRTASGQLEPPDNSGDWFFNTARRGEGPYGLGVWELTPAAAARRAAEDAAFLNNARVNDPGGFNGSAGYSPFGSYDRMRAATPAPAPAPGSYQTTVIIGGKATSIATRDKASADALIRALEDAYLAGGG